MQQAAVQARTAQRNGRLCQTTGPQWHKVAARPYPVGQSGKAARAVGRSGGMGLCKQPYRRALPSVMGGFAKPQARGGTKWRRGHIRWAKVVGRRVRWREVVAQLYPVGQSGGMAMRGGAKWGDGASGVPGRWRPVRRACPGTASRTTLHGENMAPPHDPARCGGPSLSPPGAARVRGSIVPPFPPCYIGHTDQPTEGEMA